MGNILGKRNYEVIWKLTVILININVKLSNMKLRLNNTPFICNKLRNGKYTGKTFKL